MKLIISYRRADSEVISGRIRDRLAAQFGEDSVYMDIDNIPFGADFRDHIRQAVRESDMLVAVVGPRWSGGTKRGYEQINIESDPVRVEIETAMEHRIPIIPILIGTAKMPDPAQLPDTLKSFAFINAAPLDTGRDFSLHMDRVIRLVRLVDSSKRESSASSPPNSGIPEAKNSQAPTEIRRLSVAVLPFSNMSTSPEQEFFVEGLTDDITTDLAQIVGLSVISRGTAAAYKGKSADVRQIGRELGVGYVLQGSVRTLGTVLRVNVQLSDVKTGESLWSERFDGDAASQQDLNDRVVGRITRALGLRLIEADARRISQSAAPEADDLVIRAQAIYNRHRSRANTLEARDLFARALELSPDNVDALVGIAWVESDLFALGGLERGSLDHAMAAIDKALSLAPNHSNAHWVHGQILHRQGRPEEAVSAFDAAIALDRNHSPAYDWRGYTKVFLGRAEEAEADIAHALRISLPHDPRLAVMLSHSGYALLCLGRLDEAASRLREAIAANKNFGASYLYLAAVYGLQGNMDSARKVLSEHDRLVPNYSISKYRARQPSPNPTFQAQDEPIVRTLQALGLPEG